MTSTEIETLAIASSIVAELKVGFGVESTFTN